jgi:cytoskeletal protein CcmA (bactofilin family)
MIWEKKTQPVEPKRPEPEWAPPPNPKVENPIMETTPKVSSSTPASQNPTVLGRTVVARGELSASEDLLIEGQFDGTINLKDNCLTVGAKGQVKAEISARHVVVHGSVNGNVNAREKIEIRKTGQVLGDLVAMGVAIEDGAYFKGSIEILREGEAAGSRAPRPAAATVAALSTHSGS